MYYYLETLHRLSQGNPAAVSDILDNPDFFGLSRFSGHGLWNWSYLSFARQNTPNWLKIKWKTLFWMFLTFSLLR